MSKEIARVKIADELCDYIQRLGYELSGLKVLNLQIIRLGVGDKKHYEKFLEEYKEANIAYNLAFEEICKMYTPDLLDGGYNREINFLTSELIITEGQKGGCSCEK